jgi:hypothetical protein
MPGQACRGQPPLGARHKGRQSLRDVSPLGKSRMSIERASSLTSPRDVNDEHGIARSGMADVAATTIIVLKDIESQKVRRAQDTPMSPVVTTSYRRLNLGTANPVQPRSSRTVVSPAAIPDSRMAASADESSHDGNRDNAAGEEEPDRRVQKLDVYQPCHQVRLHAFTGEISRVSTRWTGVVMPSRTLPMDPT